MFRTQFILTWLQDKTINSNGLQCDFRIASLYLSVPVLGVIQQKTVVSVGHTSEEKKKKTVTTADSNKCLIV
jgi:hypothetical protein